MSDTFQDLIMLGSKYRNILQPSDNNLNPKSYNAIDRMSDGLFL
ncbi:MAG: hypothetical protein ACLT33_13565 [Lachnospira pectinoschiza]